MSKPSKRATTLAPVAPATAAELRQGVDMSPGAMKPYTPAALANKDADAGGYLTTADFGELAGAGFEMEMTISLKQPGEGIVGVYLGPGKRVELAEEDNETGEVITVPTWRIRPLGRDKRPMVNLVLNLIGKAAINTFLEGVTVGHLVAIERGTQVDTRKGRRVNQYRTATRAPD